MAHDETYAQDTYSNAVADFDYFSDNASFPDVCSASGVCDEPGSNSDAPNWAFNTGTSPSSGTGPPASNGGCTYPESSSDAAASDICTATMKTANQVDAGAFALYVTVDTCVYGNTNATLWVQAWDGDSWENLDTIVGNATTSFTSQGPYDCTTYSNNDFYVRIRVELATSGNVYQSDFAFQNLRVYGEAAGPVISDAGDEDFTLTETNIVVTGTGFGTDTGSADLELGDSATYGSANLQSQSIDTWADTSIQFDVAIGALDQEQLWLYVTDSAATVSNAWEVHVEMTPTITNAGDELFETNETNITMTGTNFIATQGTGKLELVDNVVYGSGSKVTQSIDTWGDQSIQFDLTIGGLTDIDLWLFATNSIGHISVGYAVQVYRTPTITDIEDEIFSASESNIVLDGTYMQDTQGSGKLEISNNVVYATGTKVEQTINTWADDDLNFDLEIGAIGQTTMWMWVTNSLGRRSTGTQVTITGLPISTGLWKTSSIQGAITSAGFITTIFLITDE